MPDMRSSRIVNLASAVIVLIGGMYILFFMPVAISPVAKLIIAFLLVVYFLWRLRYFNRRYNKKPEGIRRADQDNTNSLDK